MLNNNDENTEKSPFITSGNKYPIFSAAFERSIHDSAVPNVEDDNKRFADPHHTGLSHPILTASDFLERTTVRE